ncbi:MAG: hypothetical protein PHE15_06355 [Dehalococcoidales bacterium]|nr:hypothetical protein [Dehalococcoidales bacterium]
MKKKLEINRFSAKKDKGKTYTIVEYQDVSPGGDFDRPLYKVASLISYQTSTGLPVNKIDNETFQILQTQEFVKKVN